jgi:hypothetical protein
LPLSGAAFRLIRVFRPRGEELEGFSIANVVERRRALDWSRTDYDVFPDDYFLSERRGLFRAIRRVALRADALKDVDIVRLDEFPPSVYVPNNFKKAFEEGQFTGYSFHEVVTG